MASSLVRQMTQKLKATKDGLAKKRQEHKKEEEILFSGVGTLAGAGGGAFIDTKGQNGGPHKLFAKADGTGGVPTNLVVGAALAVPAIAIKNFPMKAPAAATGLALVGVGLYRYIVDKHAQNAAGG
jgi:hypothetical protein